MVIQSTFPPLEIPQMDIVQHVFSNPYHVPNNRKILIDAITGEYLTYGQLQTNVTKFGATLQSKFDFKRGDVLALYSPNQIDYSVPLFGTVAAGGIVSPANPAYTVNELSCQLEASNTKVLIAHPSNIEIALAAAESVGLPKSNVFVFGHENVQGVAPYTQTFLSDHYTFNPVNFDKEEVHDQVAYLCFSSGTTGKSKGAMITHGNMVSNVCQYHGMERLFLDSETDRMLAAIPFFHMLGLNIILHFALLMGLPVYVMEKFDLEQFCKTVQREKISYSILVPPIVLALGKNPLVSKYDMSSLRSALCGAAPLGLDLVQEVRVKLPGFRVKQGYGLTETSPCALVDRTDCITDGSAGLLLANMTAKIVDADGQEVNTGERGELWLKGPNIMKGYINNAKATAECIDEEGYFHTGDVAIQDQNGKFFIVDRIKELIKYKGFQVPPAELESILLKSPLIADCAVIGVYDNSQATEVPRAYVTLHSNISANEQTANEIKEFVANQVVYYKQLRSVVFVNEIPKSASGKILRRVLRDAAEAEAEQIRKQTSKL